MSKKGAQVGSNLGGMLMERRVDERRNFVSNEKAYRSLSVVRPSAESGVSKKQIVYMKERKRSCKMYRRSDTKAFFNGMQRSVYKHAEVV